MATPTIKKFYASNRRKWRAWLQSNHDSEKEIWLVYFKKGTDKPSISYIESVEEALCFGWIDGLKRRIDEGSYCHRFTPRNIKSKWSDQNVRLAKKMVKEGKMTEAGLESFQQRLSYSKKIIDTIKQKEIQLSSELEKILKGNKVAWKNLNNLAPSYKKQYVIWLTMAKKPETREKRLKEAIALLEKGEKLGMK